jgi:hypothetical protein
MVAQEIEMGVRTLTPPVLVRIQVPQPFTSLETVRSRVMDKSAKSEQSDNAAAQKSAHPKGSGTSAR